MVEKVNLLIEVIILNRKCIGCGAELQSIDPNRLGYVPKEKLEDATYCLRCFKVIHYNEKVVTHLDSINETLLEKLNDFSGVVLFFLDFLNVNQETISTFLKIQSRKVLVISKYDILPKSFQEMKMISFLKNTYGILDDIVFLSTKKNVNTKSILKHLEEQGISKICITGYTNAGKSTFLNKLLQNHDMEASVTTSLNPNTTVDFIVYEHNLYQDDDFVLIRKMNSKGMIKPITYQVKKISSILIEDLFCISSDVENSFTFYMSNELEIERVFSDNQKNLLYSCISLTIQDNQDVVIKGLGFLNVKKACSLTIYCPSDYFIEVRDSMF